MSVAELVPHAGAMCLLDEVVDWQPERIHCRAEARALADHPLCDGKALPAAALIEYAAQATAAHGTLRARSGAGGAAPSAGRLVALRHIELADSTTPPTPTLPVIDVHAERIVADAGGSIYSFCVRVAHAVLARGRLTIRTVGDSRGL